MSISPSNSSRLSTAKPQIRPPPPPLNTQIGPKSFADNSAASDSPQVTTPSLKRHHAEIGTGIHAGRPAEKSARLGNVRAKASSQSPHTTSKGELSSRLNSRASSAAVRGRAGSPDLSYRQPPVPTFRNLSWNRDPTRHTQHPRRRFSSSSPQRLSRADFYPPEYRFERRCFNCGDPDHHINYCPHPTRGDRSRGAYEFESDSGPNPAQRYRKPPQNFYKDRSSDNGDTGFEVSHRYPGRPPKPGHILVNERAKENNERRKSYGGKGDVNPRSRASSLTRNRKEGLNGR